MRVVGLFAATLLFVGCREAAPEPVGADAVVADDIAVKVMRALSDDEMAGRAAGTHGALMGHIYITGMLANYTHVAKRTERFQAIGVSGESRNIVASLDADPTDTGPRLIVTAHYDHLGTRDGEIYNGADDNASGVGAVFALIEHFGANPPEHDIDFVFLDAEERGLQGAIAHVQAIGYAEDRPAFNLNLDMVSQNAEGVLYASGTRHYPEVREVVEALPPVAGVSLRFGHDDPAEGINDWTFQSDHAAFHRAGIPYLYLGVEDHPHYHKPTDEFATIPLEAYSRFVEQIVVIAEALDARLDELARTGEPPAPPEPDVEPETAE